MESEVESVCVSLLTSDVIRPEAARVDLFFTVDDLERLFVEAGFVDVVVRKEAPACAVITCAAPGAAPAASSSTPSVEEWRAACDSGVVSFYDFGVRM